MSNRLSESYFLYSVSQLCKSVQSSEPKREDQVLTEIIQNEVSARLAELPTAVQYFERPQVSDRPCHSGEFEH